MNNPAYQEKHLVVDRRIGKIALAIAMLTSVPAFAQDPVVVVSVEGCGVPGPQPPTAATTAACAIPNGTGTVTQNQNSTAGGYGDNQAGPLSLFYFNVSATASATLQNVLVFPQTASGANFPVSGEYGSSSEGTLQLSGNGTYLTIMGYGINAATFDAAYYPGFTADPYGAAPSGALAQSGSLTGQSYAPIPRVLALIDQYGNVTSQTALLNIFNTNNPRSIFTADGTTYGYVSGQGTGCDMTGGVFYFPIGGTVTAPTAITGGDAVPTSSCVASGYTGSLVAQDTRTVQIYNNTLYISIDSTEGKSDNRSLIGTLGTPPATSLFTPTNPPTGYTTGPNVVTGLGNTGGTGKETITSGVNSNGNAFNAGKQINISPSNYFFASPSVLYVADTGSPKQTSATSLLGDGGLQKWVNSQSNGTGTWSLAYTLYQGLNLVENPASSSPSNTDGATGLYGLTGVVSGGSVYLYATNYNIADLDPTYLYGITDTLSFTTASQASGETFTALATAPPDSNFKGVSLAPSSALPLTNGVTITSVPYGLPFSSSGTGCAPGTYTTPATLNWTPGSSCTLSVASTQSGPTGVQYAFAQWQDGNTNPTAEAVTAPTAPGTIYTATYTTEYLLTTSAGTGGTVSAGGYIPAGTNATITAYPSAGYYFVNFTGATTSASNPLSLLMSAPQSITANFAPQANQVIVFGPLSNQVLGAAPFMVSATATSTLPVSFTSLTTPVCTVSGTTVTLGGAGTCTIQATQDGDVDYLAAAPVNQSFLVTSPGLGTNTLPLLFGSAGGSSSVVLTFAGAWTAASNASFLHISAGSASGTGSAVVAFTYDAFTGTGTRTGTLTIAGLTLTVTQAGTNYIGPSPVTTLASGLNSPTGMAVDGAGNLYFSNAILGTIQEWNATTQQVTTLVSSGLSGPQGVAVDSLGDVYIADTGNSAIKEWNFSTQEVTTLVSGLNGPMGVAVDIFGNVYIADTGNKAIEEWNVATQQLITLVSSGLSQPNAVALDASGNVYFSDSLVNVIDEWNTVTQQVTTLVSGLNNPSGLALDGSGDVYFSDSGNQAIKEWSPATQQVTALASSGLSNPSGVAVDGSDNVYFADTGNFAIKEIPYAFVGPASGLNEAAPAGTDSLLQVLPSTTSLTGIFAPASNQSWLTIGTVANGVVNFSFVANTSSSPRTALITFLGQTISVTQIGLVAPTVSFTGAPTSAPYGATFPVVATTNASTTAVITASGSCSISVTTVTITAPSGTCLLAANWPADGNYLAASATQSTTATIATPLINWATPAAITYGTALTATQLDATATSNGATVAGKFVYTPIKGTVLTAGSQTLSVTFTPTNTTDYTSASASVTLQVNQASPKITWATPAAIAYGTGLSGTQLDASASVPGSFVYTPAAGTILGAGSAQTLSVTFTPTDSVDYATVSDTVSINVKQAAPTITWATPAAITYGTALSSTQLDATASVPGTFVYSPAAGAIEAGGSDKLSVTFTPTDTVDYTTATASVMLQVNQATPTITWATPAAITYGTALTGTQLDATATYNGATVAGTLTYTPAKGAVLTAGSQTLSVTFTPNNTNNYAVPPSVSVTLQVNQATPKITWAKPSAITYGTALSSTQLDAAASVSGSFVYSPAAGAILTAGAQTLSATFTPTDTVDYATATDSVTITVNQAASSTVITSGTPNPGTVGAPVTVYFTVSGTGVPTGMVTVTATSGQTCSGPLSAGSGSCSLTFTATGSPKLTASYPGDTNFKSSKSATYTEVAQ